MERGDHVRVRYLNTRLPMALAKMDEELIRKLLDSKVDVDTRLEHQRTPLHVAGFSRASIHAVAHQHHHPLLAYIH